MYQDTVTIFNRKRLVGRDVWYPTVLRWVHLIVDRAAIVEQYGASSSDNAVLHVEYDERDGEIAFSGKKYLTPKMWQQAGDPAGAVTFTPGTDKDHFQQEIVPLYRPVIIRQYLKDWPSEAPIEDNDYEGGLYHYLNRTRDHVFAVTAAAKYRIIPHFEVTGK